MNQGNKKILFQKDFSSQLGNSLLIGRLFKAAIHILLVSIWKCDFANAQYGPVVRTYLTNLVSNNSYFKNTKSTLCLS